MDKKNLEKKVGKELRIDPSTSPYTLHNKEVAEELGWRYDPINKCYRDEEGYPVADEFGQLLG